MLSLQQPVAGTKRKYDDWDLPKNPDAHDQPAHLYPASMALVGCASLELCGICMEELGVVPGSLHRLSGCKHVFHKKCLEDCVDQWKAFLPLSLLRFTAALHSHAHALQ